MENGSRTVFKCGYLNCDRKFDTWGKLNAHLKEKHRNDKSRIVFKCGYTDCKKWFNTKSELKRHLLTHKPAYNRYASKKQHRQFRSRFNQLAVLLVLTLIIAGEYFFDSSLLFAITIGIIAFILSILTLIRLFKWGDRLRMMSDLEVFIARIFSAIFAPVSFIVTLLGGFALPGLLTYYVAGQVKNMGQALIYLITGVDIFIFVFLITFGFGLAVFSAFMFFRFMRRSGNILWFR